MPLTNVQSVPETRANDNAYMERANEVPDWVRSMHQYFQAHGRYRAQDIKHVLGDPREVVSISGDGKIVQCSVLK